MGITMLKTKVTGNHTAVNAEESGGWPKSERLSETQRQQLSFENVNCYRLTFVEPWARESA